MKKNENDKITSGQYTKMIFANIVGAGILSMPATAGEAAGSDGWIVTLAAGMVVMVILLLLTRLALRFPRETFGSFSQKIVGKWLGLICSILFIIYFFAVSVYEVRVFGEVSLVYLMDQTPLETIMFIYLLVVVIGVRGGIEVIARICEVSAIIIIAISILFGSLLLPKVDYTHLMPIFHIPWQVFLKAVFSISLSYLGFEMILFLGPHLSEPQKAMKNAVVGMGIITVFYTYMVARGIALHGPEDIKTLLWPAIESVKMIDFRGVIFDRMESMVLAAWATAAFTTSIIFLYMLAQALIAITGWQEYKPFLVFLMPFIFAFALLPQNIYKTFAIGNMIGTYGLILVSGIPIILLLIAKIRKKGEKNGFQTKN